METETDEGVRQETSKGGKGKERLKGEEEARQQEEADKRKIKERQDGAGLKKE